MKFEWEKVTSNTRRARVFGGWVLKNFTWDADWESQSESMVFIPDENHEWEIE